MAYVRPRHLIPMTHFNNIAEIIGYGNGNGMNEASPQITNKVNIGALALEYGMTQIVYNHLSSALVNGKITISATTAVGGAVLTEFDWTLDPISGNVLANKINWQTGSTFNTVGIGADGTAVMMICVPQSASVIRFSFTPPAAAPAQAYAFATAALGSGLQF